MEPTLPLTPPLSDISQTVQPKGSESETGWECDWAQCLCCPGGQETPLVDMAPGLSEALA